MAVHMLFQAVADNFINAMGVATDIGVQITEMKARTPNSELDKMHVLFHEKYLAPATGEEQKLALMLLCPGFSACSNPCVVGTVPM